ncbi:MAG TPA: hypothetical protein VFL59_08000 [Candidatus Nanopelagicales bacterium]|nr:hypothetical protein [Candidatus Nanopelagicales bacterium]
MNPLTALLLSTVTPSPSSSTKPGTPDPDTVTAGWWGFLGLLFLSIAVFFLWKSMNKQLKRVTFDEVPVEPDEAAADDVEGSTVDAAAVEEPTPPAAG